MKIVLRQSHPRKAIDELVILTFGFLYILVERHCIAQINQFREIYSNKTDRDNGFRRPEKLAYNIKHVQPLLSLRSSATLILVAKWQPNQL